MSLTKSIYYVNIHDTNETTYIIIPNSNSSMIGCQIKDSRKRIFADSVVNGYLIKPGEITKAATPMGIFTRKVKVKNRTIPCDGIE